MGSTARIAFNQMVGTVQDPVWARSAKTPARERRKERIYPIRAARADGKVIFDGSGARRLAALHANAVCSAHVYHVQQQAHPQACLVLHLTFVEGWPKNPAKCVGGHLS